MSYVGFSSSLGSSSSLQLIAQNGSVVTLTDLNDPKLKTDGLLPVEAISCYGCEVIQSADASECPGKFERD